VSAGIMAALGPAEAHRIVVSLVRDSAAPRADGVFGLDEGRSGTWLSHRPWGM
jgi:hypothetical protein